MPLVFTQNEVSVEDRDYADVLGKIYEYPARYRKLIQTGEPFVYYRGRRRADGSSQTPSYLGCGRVGKITEVGDRFRCTIENFQEFEKAVPFKRGETYREPEANLRSAVGFYFQVGVRSLDQKSFDEIVAAGLGDPAPKTAALKRGIVTSALPNAEDKAHGDVKAHQLALNRAKLEARSQWPTGRIFQAPTGQHFSLIVK